jgi:hypothetical protein
MSNANRPGAVLFAAAIEKTNLLYGEDAVDHATAEVCRRFDLFLKRQYLEEDNAQRDPPLSRYFWIGSTGKMASCSALFIIEQTT